jgi:hypothetical protein
VKLYSTNLLIMAAFLAAGDAKRLINVFLLNRSTSPVSLEPPRFQRIWMHRATVAFWVLFVGFELYSQISGGWSGYKQTYLSARPAIYGLYEVATFERDSTKLGMTVNASPWEKIEFQPTYASARRKENSVARFSVNYLEKESKVVLNKLDTLVWSRPDPSRLTLKGNLDGSPISVELRQIDPAKFLLVNRGFHWINEFPFNR